MIESLIQWWRSISTRERRMVGLAAGVLAVAVVYLLLVEPAWSGRAKLEAELPALRRQAVRMDAMANEAKGLAGVSATRFTLSAARGQLESSLEAAGLKSFATQIQVSGESIELRFARVPFDRWIAWLEPAVRAARLRVVDASVQREAASGLVAVRVSLEGPRKEAGP